MKFLGLIRIGFSLLIVLFLADSTGRSHGPAALDYMDEDDVTTIGPMEDFPIQCTGGCNTNFQTQETNDDSVLTGFCSFPPDIENAELNEDYLESNVFLTGATVMYTCQTGYSPSPGAIVTVTCLADGTWSFGSLCKFNPVNNGQIKPTTAGSHLPVNPTDNGQIKPTTAGSHLPGFCSSPPDILNAELSETFSKQTVFPKDSTVTLNCQTGYLPTPEQSLTAKCLSDGTWTSNSVCSRICRSPPDIPYAELKDAFLKDVDFLQGATVSYKCKPDFQHIPGTKEFVTCIDGKWSTNDFFCKPNFCGSPPRLDYGQPRDENLERTLFAIGTKILYVCRPGYIKIPGQSSVITCMVDATWSLPNIFCKRRSCGNPGDVENGQMQAENFDFGSRVTYTCGQGYKMISRRNYRDCLANGVWSNDLPACAVQACPPPPRISYGHYYPDKDDYIYLDSVRYICNSGLTVIGEYSLACGEDGKWSSAAPECRSVRCPDPYVENAYKSSGFSGPYHLNSAVRFTCRSQYNMQYTLVGSGTVKCNQSNQWEPELPKCFGTCLTLPRIKYAEMVEPTNETRFLEGTQLKYKCKEGYELVPDAMDTVTCSRFAWSPAHEFCTPIPCVEPESVPNGRLIAGLFSFGNRITYTCDIGFRMKNISYRECLSNQSWSLPIPECEVQTCPVLTWSNNGWCDPEEQQYFYNDTISFGCHEGYKLIGQDLITCNHDGRWNYRVPECRGICKDPPIFDYAILNAKYEPTAVFLSGSTVQYTCKRGYIQKTKFTNYSTTCMENSQWSSMPEDFCSRRSCGRPPRVENAVLEENDFLFESEAIYKCEKGYKMDSPSNPIFCQSNGRWNSTLPVCKVLTCSPPEDLENGSYSLKKNEYLYGETVTYECNKFQLVGNASISCADEGQWSSGAPQCRDACTLPPKLPFAVVDTKFNPEYADKEQSIQYKCRPGFVPVKGKPNTITCLENLKWSKYEVFCTPITCDVPRKIENGEVHSENFFFGSRVNYTCNPGYSMMSKRNYIECQADGTWSGKPPVCKEPVCDKIWELQEEARKCTSTPDEWIKYLQVQYLYLEIENMKLDNEIKKKQLEATN